MEISPHSSLDPEQYRLYLASQSIQSQQFLQQEQADSGIDDSSPISASLRYPERVRSGIVPDSQSIPGSSSYLPTDSIDSPSVSHTSGDIRGGFIDPRLLSRRESPNVRISTGSDPIQDTFSSQGLSERPTAQNRQLSEPIEIEDSRRDSRNQYSSFELYYRSTASSPGITALTLGNQFNSPNQTASGPGIADSRVGPVPSSLFEPETEGTSGIALPSTGISTNDNLDPEGLQSDLAQEIPNDKDADTLAFQTQIPLAFDDHLSEFTSESSSTPG